MYVLYVPMPERDIRIHIPIDYTIYVFSVSNSIRIINLTLTGH